MIGISNPFYASSTPGFVLDAGSRNVKKQLVPVLNLNWPQLAEMITENLGSMCSQGGENRF